MAFRCLLVLLLAATNVLCAAEVVSFQSDKVTLHGVMYRPLGPGPFRAGRYNHGSAIDNSALSDLLLWSMGEEALRLMQHWAL